MDDPISKEIICRNARKLREGNDFVNIYINEDKTKSQSLIDKELRDERNKRNNMLQDLGRHLGDKEYGTGKYYWTIRSGALKKILVEPQ